MREERPAGVTITIRSERRDSLDALRRVLAFANDLQTIGVRVRVRGELAVDAYLEPEAPVEVITPVGDVTPEEAHALARRHASRVANAAKAARDA